MNRCGALAKAAVVACWVCAGVPAEAAPGGRTGSSESGTAQHEGWPSPRVVANGDLESPLDNKGRIPMWSEEADGTLLPGRRAGTLALDGSAPCEGKNSIALSPTGDWFGVSSINYPNPPWSDRVQLTAKARCGEGTQAQVLAVWADDYAQHVIRVDFGEVVNGPDWQRVSTGVLTPPAEARVVRIVMVARKSPGSVAATGRVWFDDAELATLPPGKPAVHVLINQVGYDRGMPKGAVILTNLIPDDAVGGTFELMTADGRVMFQSPVTYAGRMRGEGGADWGWYFWRAGFSQFDQEGSYRARARIGGAEGMSFPFAIGPRLLFRETAEIGVDFFFVQRCGFAVPGWHAACHMDGAKLPDGSHRDLTGGWHSAGDYNKLTWEYGDGGVMYALINAFESDPAYFSQFDRDGDGLADVLDEAWWGARYMAKIQVPETGGLLKDIQQGPDRKTWMRWVPPEKQTDNIPNTADDPIVLAGEGHSPLAIGGWARLGTLLTARGRKNDFGARAGNLWQSCTRNQGAESSPLLLISAVDLYLENREAAVLEFARRSVESLLAPAAPDGRLKGGYTDSGDIPAAALAHFALKLPNEAPAARIRERLKRHLPLFLSEADNPLGIPLHKQGERAYFFEPTSTLGWNYVFSCRAWSALMVYRIVGDRRALDYALNQLDFVLGKNPYNLCMMEGKGSFNPPRYHHRYNTIPGRQRGAVPGAIPNGFVRDVAGYDRPGFDLSTQGREYPSYRTNEPWLVHNVFYMLAITALHEAER